MRSLYWGVVIGIIGLSGRGAILASQVPASSSSSAAARAEVDRLIAASGAEVAVVWQPLEASDGRSPVLIHADLRFHAASTMKLPVMIALFQQVATGLLRLDDPVLVTNQFHSIVDGSVYELSASEDSDGETYKAIGKPMTLRALCEAMITVSSNLAANNLIERLGARTIQATVDRLGAGGMQVLRGVEDQKAFDAGKNNTTNAAGLATLLTKLGRGEVLSPEASAEMIGVLRRQKLNDAIPAGLPAGTVIAHKTGTITRIHHDAGIVYGPRPYVLVVLVRGIQDQRVSAKLIADVARVVNGIR